MLPSHILEAYTSYDSQLELWDKVRESNIRARLWTFRERMLAKNDAPAFLTAIDNMCILFINTMAGHGEGRYRVYTSTGCAVFHRMEDMRNILRSAQDKGTTVRGVALGKDHFCSLHPSPLICSQTSQAMTP